MEIFGAGGTQGPQPIYPRLAAFSVDAGQSVHAGAPRDHVEISPLGQMLDGHRLNMSIPERPWQEPAYGLGLMCAKVPIDGFVAGHSGGGPGSVISVYRLYDRQPIRTGAAFLPGDDAGAVERAAILHAARQSRAHDPSPGSR